MKYDLTWIPCNEIKDKSGFLPEELKILRKNNKSVVVSMEAYGGVSEEDLSGFFRCELTLLEEEAKDIKSDEFYLLDFGYIANIREVVFYLNGIEIGKTETAATNAAFLIPGYYYDKAGKNSILASVIRGTGQTIWKKSPDGKSKPVNVDPANGNALADELPSCLCLEAMEKIQGISKVIDNGKGVDILLATGQKASINFFQEGIFRMKFTRNREEETLYRVDDLCLEEMEKNLKPLPDYRVHRMDRLYSVNAGEIQVLLYKEPFGIEVVNREGKVLLSHRSGIMLYENALGLAVTLEDDEHIFGLGENATPRLDKRGHREDIWVIHSFVKCDIPVPFYISSRGYGFYLNNSYHSIFDMGAMNSKKAIIWSLGGEMDYFFIYGPQPKKILSSFTAITGRPKLPPRWAFGFWQSTTRNDGQQEVMDHVDRFHHENIPIDVIAIDPVWEHRLNDLKWELSKFPEPEKFLGFLKEEDLHLCLWTSPFVNQECENFKEGIEKGYFLRNREGRYLPVYWWKGKEAGLVDFCNPEAVEWWRSKLKFLTDMGVDLFKIDGGDSREFPAEGINFEGRSGHELHNLYPLYFAKAFYDFLQRERPDERVIVWQRTGFTGSGKYPCTWGGDQIADFSGTRVLIKAGQAAGLVGIPFWSQDVGGFAHCDGKTEEFFIRSYQWGLLAPLARAHGNNNEPWCYGERAKDIIKSYIELRYRLLPYIYSYAHEAVKTGVPIMRATFLECQEDAEACSADYQYFLGEYIMVAPIFEAGREKDLSAQRDIYLPQGNWIDFWSDEEYTGGRHIQYKASLERLPIFIKEGAILPMGPILKNTKEYTGEKLYIHVYPSSRHTEFDFFDDDGVSLGYQRGEYEQIKFEAVKEDVSVRLKLGSAEGSYRGQIQHVQISFIVHGIKDVKSVDAIGTCNPSCSWSHTASQSIVTVNVNYDKKDALEIVLN